MTRILTVALMAAFLQPAMAQRKHNRTAEGKAPLYIYTVKVNGGSFDMGSNVEGSDRKPLHTVTLKEYNIGMYEVTQLQWKTIMNSNPSIYQCDQCPVTNVDYEQVQVFINKLNSTTGKHYRLPTEAEWEYAARGGEKEELIKEGRNMGGVNELVVNSEHKRVPDKYVTGKKYAGNRTPGEVAWFQRNSEDHAHPIGRKKANELGIYDMCGNVEEWCSDWYAGSFGSKNAVENPQGPAGGKARVVRGGSWSSSAEEVTVTRRAAYLPDTKSASLGFRLVEDK